MVKLKKINETVKYNQKGYIGQSMSVRAKDAYDLGEMPKSKWTKSLLLQTLSDEFGDLEASGFSKFSKDRLFDGVMEKTSWHHTGMFANPTDFYSLSRSKAMEFAEDNNIESMMEVLSKDRESMNRELEKEKEIERKAKDEFIKMQQKIKRDKYNFIDNVKYTVTEPKQLPDGSWLITFKSDSSDNAKKRYITYAYAKAAYDRLLSGHNDPDINKDDFWDRMFYAGSY